MLSQAKNYKPGAFLIQPDTEEEAEVCKKEIAAQSYSTTHC